MISSMHSIFCHQQNDCSNRRCVHKIILTCSFALTSYLFWICKEGPELHQRWNSQVTKISITIDQCCSKFPTWSGAIPPDLFSFLMGINDFSFNFENWLRIWRRKGYVLRNIPPVLPIHGGKLTNLVSFAQLLGSRQNISQSVQNHIDGFLVLETKTT